MKGEKEKMKKELTDNIDVFYNLTGHVILTDAGHLPHHDRRDLWILFLAGTAGLKWDLRRMYVG